MSQMEEFLKQVEAVQGKEEKVLIVTGPRRVAQTRGMGTRWMHRQRDCGKHRHKPRYLVYMEEKISNFSRYLKKGKRCCGQTGGKKFVTTGTRV